MIPWDQIHIMQASDGRIYGVSSDGGANEQGLIFGMDLDGQNFSVLHQRPSGPNYFETPILPLVEGPDGRFYGGGY